MRNSWAIALFTCALLLAGCAGAPVLTTSNSQTGTVPGTALQGRVHGGQQPISGASVYLYAVTTTGYGAASQSLLNSPGYVATDSNGNFSITGDYTCPTGAQVYIYSVGGNPGLASGTNNTAAGLLAGLGSCSALTSSTFILVNEVSTVATAYALAGYAKDATDISSSNTTLAATGVANAMGTIANLETLSTGVGLGTTPGGNGVVPWSEIDTLANILAACINTTSSSSTPCSTLFSNAMNGAIAPTDTATAAINIAHNPGTDVSNLFALQGASPPFIPDLAAAPNDFTIAIDYGGYTGHSTGCTLSGAKGIAVGGKGDIWVTNFGGNSICEFNPLGVPEQAAAITGNGLSEPEDIAIDGNGYVWVTSESPAALSSFASTGTAVANTTSGGLNSSFNLAIDGSNNIWVINQGGKSLTEFSNSSGTPSTVTGDPFGTSVLNYPIGIAVDISGNVWVGNQISTGNIVEFSGSSPSTTSTHSGGGLSQPISIAFDPSGDFWVTDYSARGALSKFNSSGGAISSTAYTGGGLDEPYGIAIDSNGNVWVANSFGNTISEFNSSGVALSPSTGFGANGAAGLGGPYYLAVDGSGNIWVANNGGGTITEFVGIAAPVVTPKAANFQSPYSTNSSAVNRP